MARPYWSGQIQISLVSFGVSFFTATEAASEITFHQIDRKTGERIRHRNVAEDRGVVEKADIVKGYEYRKGEYVTLEPEEIAKLRIPSKKTLQIQQFVDIDEIDPAFFEKPYFVLPESDTQAEAFAVIQKALRDTNKAGLGEAAFAGREHLIAIMPPNDPKSRGLMAYAMRYAAELRDPADYFDTIPQTTIDKGQLSLAQELIRRNTAKFSPEKYVDDYEAALRKLVDAKVAHKPLPQEKPEPRRAKVINLMDALRRSVGDSEDEAPARRPHAARSESGAHRGKARSGGLKLVKPATRRKRTA
jgi:DNA end-binding protein Ku